MRAGKGHTQQHQKYNIRSSGGKDAHTRNNNNINTEETCMRRRRNRARGGGGDAPEEEETRTMTRRARGLKKPWGRGGKTQLKNPWGQERKGKGH